MPAETLHFIKILQKTLQSISGSERNVEPSTSKLFFQNELRHLIRDQFGNDMYTAIGQSVERGRIWF